MAFQITVTVEGLDKMKADYEAMAARIDRAAFTGVRDAVGILHRAIATELTRTSHPLGTPTPAPPGSPPSLVTGHLRRSIVNLSTRRLSKGVYEGGTGPTAVQARIQELGGFAGRGHRSHLPPRPYVRPAVRNGGRAAARTFLNSVTAAMRGV